jgi:DDE family transposase
VKRIKRSRRVKVSADGRGVVSHAGVGMLRELACDTGLVAGVTEALADTYAGPWLHPPGQVFADMAVAIADGGDCVSHIEVFGDQHQVCGPVASMPTTWRMLDKIDQAHLPAILAARAAARERAWAAGAGPDLTGLIQIDFDATVTISHSEEKETLRKHGNGRSVTIRCWRSWTAQRFPAARHWLVCCAQVTPGATRRPTTSRC